MIQQLKRPHKRLGRAIGLMVFANVFCATQALLVKEGAAYFTTNALVFGRCLVNLILLYGWVMCTQGISGMRALYVTKTLKYHFLRSCLGVGGMYCFYYALHLLSLSLTTLLFFTFPVFIPLVTRLWLKVKIVHRLWWGLAVSFLGIMLVLHPSGRFLQWAIFIPLVGAVFTSISVVTIRVLHYHAESTSTIMAYYFSLGVLVSFCLLWVGGELSIKALTGSGGALILSIGVAAALFQTLLTLAAKYAPSRFLSPFIYGVFIFSALGDYWIWKTLPSWVTCLGFLLVCLGSVLMVVLYPKNDMTFVRKQEENHPEDSGVT